MCLGRGAQARGPSPISLDGLQLLPVRVSGQSEALVRPVFGGRSHQGDPVLPRSLLGPTRHFPNAFKATPAMPCLAGPATHFCHATGIDVSVAGHAPSVDAQESIDVFREYAAELGALMMSGESEDSLRPAGVVRTRATLLDWCDVLAADMAARSGESNSHVFRSLIRKRLGASSMRLGVH